MKIALATDHAGFEQLKQLKTFLESLGHECVDFGPKVHDPNDDYPDFIFPAAKSVAAGEFDRGVILGGSGQGEAMAANRVKGVRCTVFYGVAKTVGAVDVSGRESDDPFEIIRLSVEHNNANMLSLAARFVSLDDMKKALKIWLENSFTGEERHTRRIAKLDSEA